MPNEITKSEITKKEIGVGVIGMGWMGGCHSRSYRNLGDRFHESGISAKLIICSDSIEERAKECQARYGFLESTSNWREVIEHPEVQAVSITAPNGMHLEMIEAAAAAGKHVYCEKPAGKDPNETALAERAARKAGIVSKLGYNYRYPPVLQYAMALVNAGKLGRLTHYRGRFFSCYASDPYGLFSWRFEKENGHGTLTDLMSHTIDMAHMVVGPVKRLCSNIKIIIDKRPIPSDDGASHYAKGSADSEMATVTNDDYVGAIVEFENGVVGTIESCRVTNGPKTDMGFELNGTKGSIKWNFESMNEVHVQFRSEELAEEGYTKILSSPAHPYHANFNPSPGTGLGYDDLKQIECFEFISAIVNGTDCPPGLKEALAVANVQQTMLDSWHAQAWQELVKLDKE